MKSTLFVYAFMTVCVLEWCLSPSGLSSFVQVSLSGTQCISRDILIKKKKGGAGGRARCDRRRVRSEWKRERRDRCIKNRSLSLHVCPLCRFACSGVSVTLAGTMKRCEFHRKGDSMTSFRGKSTRVWGWHFWTVAEKPHLACAATHTTRSLSPSALRRKPLTHYMIIYLTHCLERHLKYTHVTRIYCWQWSRVNVFSLYMGIP